MTCMQSHFTLMPPALFLLCTNASHLYGYTIGVHLCTFLASLIGSWASQRWGPHLPFLPFSKVRWSRWSFACTHPCSSFSPPLGNCVASNTSHFLILNLGRIITLRNRVVGVSVLCVGTRRGTFIFYLSLFWNSWKMKSVGGVRFPMPEVSLWWSLFQVQGHEKWLTVISGQEPLSPQWGLLINYSNTFHDYWQKIKI